MTKTSAGQMAEILDQEVEQTVLNTETPESFSMKRLTFDLIDQNWADLLVTVNFITGVKKIAEIQKLPIGTTRRISVSRPDGTSIVYKNHIIMELNITPNPQVILKAASLEDGNINKFPVPAHSIIAIEYE